MNITGAQLSKQFNRARQMWPFIDEINRSHGLAPFLLYAVGSRETNLDPKFAQGTLGDAGHGHGIWQLDDQNRPGKTPRNIPREFDFDVRLQAHKAAEMLADLHSRFKDWTKACNAYNSGSPLTSKTTGKDYGPDVMGRRNFLETSVGGHAEQTSGLPSIDAVRAEFARWDGTEENPRKSNFVPFNDWFFGKRVSAFWCATYVSYCLSHAGLPIPATTSKGFAFTPSGAEYFKKRGRFGKEPRVGALAFYFHADVGRIAHVGWVDQVNPDGTFFAWEGNTDERGGRTGGRVIRQHRSIASLGKTGGFGHIDYGSGDLERETEDMFTFGVNSQDATLGGIWLLAGDGRAHHVPSPTDLEHLKVAGVRDAGEMSADFLVRFERVHPALGNLHS
jgi:hypothetical protein